MTSVWLPPTIEDDEEVAIEESDSEEEAPEKERGRGAKAKPGDSLFSDEFSFPAAAEAGGEEGVWEVEEEVLEWADRRKQLMLTSLDSKILRAIEQRKLKARMVYTWSA